MSELCPCVQNFVLHKRTDVLVLFFCLVAIGEPPFWLGGDGMVDFRGLL